MSSLSDGEGGGLIGVINPRHSPSQWPDSAPGLVFTSLQRPLCCLAAGQGAGRKGLPGRRDTSTFSTGWSTGPSSFLSSSSSSSGCSPTPCPASLWFFFFFFKPFFVPLN